MKLILKNVTVVLIVLGSPLLLNGCVAALLGAGLGVAADNAGPDDKRHFQEINLQREKDGLPPLTWDQYKHPQTTDQPQKTIIATIEKITLLCGHNALWLFCET